ncbi:MAG: hypothetical protein KGL39_46960 [Patescibacteria group bacterium]|nr:hypothetical protein [Patescibacteria group bacterium]
MTVDELCLWLNAPGTVGELRKFAHFVRDDRWARDGHVLSEDEQHLWTLAWIFEQIRACDAPEAEAWAWELIDDWRYRRVPIGDLWHSPTLESRIRSALAHIHGRIHGSQNA